MATLEPAITLPPIQIPAQNNTPAITDIQLVATAVYRAKVDLGWSPLADENPVVRFTVYRNGSTLATVNAGTFGYDDTRVAPATTYTYLVEAFDASGQRVARSNPIRVTTRGNRR